MDSILTQVQTLAGSANEATRKSIISSLRATANSLEAHDDTMERIMFSALQISAVRTGVDLKIFEILAKNGGSLSIEQLSKETGSDPLLLARLVRYLASVDVVKETGKDQFAANNITKTLAQPGSGEGIIHYFDTVGPIYQAMPAHLKKIKYADIVDPTATVFQDAWKTPAPVFVWFPQQPELWNAFNTHMAHRRAAMPTWLSVYPVEAETKGWDPEKPVFVDVGGGIGHQCAEFKEKFPQVPGKIVLQDLPHSIDHAVPTPGVENQVHDFFTPNPVKGAKFYYMRGVLHDFPDDKCIEIISNVKSAMGPDSVLLIDDMVLPDTHVHWQATQVDLTMMGALAARERTTEQWHALLDKAGFKLVKTYVYTPSCHESVTLAVPK